VLDFRALADALPQLVWVTRHPDSVLVYLNRRWMDYTGLSWEQTVDGGWRAVLHPDDVAPQAASWARVLQTGEPHLFEYRLRAAADGLYHWFLVREVPVRDASGAIVQWVGTATDISERRRLESEREALLAAAVERADRDPLTGLFNHRAFHHRLHVDAERAQSAQTPLAVAALDLDGFKPFNDAFGHLAGDEALCWVADILQRACDGIPSGGAIAARVGGDEFAALLPGLDRRAAETWAACLRAAVAAVGFRPRTITTVPDGRPPGEIPVRISVGVAATTPGGPGCAGSDLYRAADASAMRSKAAGGSRVETANEEAEGVRAHLCAAIDGFADLDALASGAGGRDRGRARRHAGDVLMYSLRIAEGLGLPADRLDALSVAALLHDVAMAVVAPEHILRHPGPLSAAEHTLLQRHPVVGALMVSAAAPGLCGEVAAAIRCHHERWDGAGYPNGLAGEAIPLLARIVGVAEGFASMTADRPYRSGVPRSEALAEMAAGSGSQWDAECVRALLRHLPPDTAFPTSRDLAIGFSK
jgi:diguanylate cyclase (GGDEF)-like protein/PAS domain S-box-containing protein